MRRDLNIFSLHQKSHSLIEGKKNIHNMDWLYVKKKYERNSRIMIKRKKNLHRSRYAAIILCTKLTTSWRLTCNIFCTINIIVVVVHIKVMCTC